MDKIFEMLGVEKLDESKQGKLKDAMETIIESKAVKIAEDKVSALLVDKKDELVEEYEGKFETYKSEITEKFSNFVDGILDTEMIIPENVIKYAHLGETYEELIEQFKVRLAIDEGMIDEETKDMLREAKDEIEALREKLDESTGKTLDLEKDASEMAAHIYLRKKCDGLTESQKAHVINMLGDVVIKESIDEKFEYIVQSLKLVESDDEGDDDEGDDEGDVFEMKCKECGNVDSVKEKSGKCSECGGKLVEMEDEDPKDKKKDKMEESTNPYNMWLETLQKNTL